MEAEGMLIPSWRWRRIEEYQEEYEDAGDPENEFL